MPRIVQKSGRDQSGDIPAKKKGQLADAALDLNDMYELLDEIEEFSRMLQGQTLTQSGYKMIGLKIDALSQKQKLNIFKFLSKLQAIGVPIEPVEH